MIPLEGIEKVRFPDDRAASRVNEYRGGFHQIKVFAADHTDCFGRLSHVYTDDIRSPEDIVEGNPFRQIMLWMKTPGDDAHPNSLRKPRNLASNSAGPHQAHCLSI